MHACVWLHVWKQWQPSSKKHFAYTAREGRQHTRLPASKSTHRHFNNTHIQLTAQIHMWVYVCMYVCVLSVPAHMAAWAPTRENLGSVAALMLSLGAAWGMEIFSWVRIGRRMRRVTRLEALRRRRMHRSSGSRSQLTLMWFTWREAERETERDREISDNPCTTGIPVNWFEPFLNLSLCEFVKEQSKVKSAIILFKHIYICVYTIQANNYLTRYHKHTIFLQINTTPTHVVWHWMK